MPTSTNVTNLKINTLTEAQFDTAVQGGVIGVNELSILTDAEAGQVIQVSTLPTASADELGNIYQFIGTTDANYTNGYFYKCVSDGQTPATYSWTQTDVQPQSGGLPTQTGNAGKFLTTDGTDASWSNQLDGNLDVNSNIGLRVKRTNNLSVFQTNLTSGLNKAETELQVGIGTSSNPWDTQAKFILSYDRTSPSARTATFYAAGNSVDIKNLGSSIDKWNSIYVTKINNGADITVPNVAGEMAVKQVNSTITLTAAGWSSNTQTVSVTGVTVDGVVLVSPDPTDQADYTSAGIICSAQAAGTLTFTCDTVPSGDIDVNVVML